MSINYKNYIYVFVFSFIIFSGCSTAREKGLTAPEKTAIKYFNAFLDADSEKLKALSTAKHYQEKFKDMGKKETFKPNLLSLLLSTKGGTYTKELRYLDDNTAMLNILLFKKAKMGWQLTLTKDANNWKVDSAKPTIDPRYQALYITIKETGLSADKLFLQPDDTVILVQSNIEELVRCKLFKLLTENRGAEDNRQIRLGFQTPAKGTRELIIPKGLDSNDYQLICQSEGSYHQSVNFNVR